MEANILEDRGISFDKIVLGLGKHFFAEGQPYAISRVKSCDGFAE